MAVLFRSSLFTRTACAVAIAVAVQSPFALVGAQNTLISADPVDTSRAAAIPVSVLPERWNQLSQGQIIRLASLRKRADFGWKSDTEAVAFFLQLPRGFSRDSALQWHEEGGKSGEERRTQEKWIRTPLQLATEVFNYTGSVENLDFSNLWYAFRTSEDGGNLICATARVNAVLSRVKMNKGLEFDVVHNRSEGALFLLGVPFPLDTVRARKLQLPSGTPAFLPGSEFKIDSPYGPWYLRATGRVAFANGARTVEDYALTLVGQKDQRDQLWEQSFGTWLDSSFVDVPELYLVGDVLNDTLPDALFLRRPKTGGLELTLWVSDDAPDGVLWRLAATWLLPPEVGD